MSPLLRLLAFFFVLACMPNPVGVRADDDSVTIGAIFSLTGFGQTWGEQARRGVEFAVEEINASGGINGKPLKVIFEDSGSAQTGAISAFQKLTTTQNIKVVIGDILSFITLPLVPLANKQKVLLVSPSIFDTDMPKESEYFFSTCPAKSSIRPAIDAFFDRMPSVKTVGIICSDTSWGKTYLDVWNDSMKAKGIKNVVTICTGDFTTDFRAEILKLKEKAPHAVIVPFGIDRAVRRMRELKFNVPILSTSDVMEAIYRREFPVTEAEGISFNDWIAESEFRAAFEKRYETRSIMEPQNSYEALRAVAYALRKNLPDPRAAMSSIKYDGVSGPIDFTASHAGNHAIATLMTVENEQVVAAK